MQGGALPTLHPPKGLVSAGKSLGGTAMCGASGDAAALEVGVQDAILIGAAADAKAAAIVRDHFRGVVRDLSGPRGPGNQPSPPSAFVLQLADPGATLPRFCGSL